MINGANIMVLKSSNGEMEPQAEPEMPVGPAPSAGKEAATGKPTPEQIVKIKKRAMHAKQLQAAFGGIVGVLMRTPQCQRMPLAGLQELVVPAISTGQFVIAQAHEKNSGVTVPVAAVLWARVSEEIDRRLSDDRGEPVKLAPKDWNSGDIPWLIFAAGDQRVIQASVQRLQETILDGRPLKSRTVDSQDKGVATLTPSTEMSAGEGALA